MNKQHSKHINDELKTCGESLRTAWRRSGKSLLALASDCNLSINTIKALFAGKPGNIANYMTIAEQTGTKLSQHLAQDNSACKAEDAAVTPTI